MKKYLSVFLLLFLLGITELVTQTRTITGTVLHKYDGDPVIGADIQIWGTMIGTVTDFDGNFMLLYPFTEKGVLEVSYIGYRKEEVTIDPDKSHYIIKMEEDAMMLEEVVVISYGTVKKQIYQVLSRP